MATLQQDKTRLERQVAALQEDKEGDLAILQASEPHDLTWPYTYYVRGNSFRAKHALLEFKRVSEIDFWWGLAANITLVSSMLWFGRMLPNPPPPPQSTEYGNS